MESQSSEPEIPSRSDRVPISGSAASRQGANATRPGRPPLFPMLSYVVDG